MKFKNFLLVIAAFLFVCNTGFAQSSKSKSKAVKKTEKLNTELKSSNPALALNDSQKEQIAALHIERMEEVAAFRKTNSNEDEVKAKSKELNKALKGKIQDILTPEQANAQKASRKNRKGNKAKGAAKANKKSKKSKKKAKNGAASISDAEVEEIYAAASKKQVARAEKSTEKLNAKLTAADASLALSDDQRKKITAVNLKSGLKAAKMKDEGLSKEEIKVKNKEFVKSNKRVIKSILTKEQKDATKKKK